MKEVVIAGYLRTAQSRSRPNDPARDWFCKIRGDELLAKILPEVIKRTGVKPEEIDDFLVGCATAVGEQWAYGGRMPIFLANLPESIPAKFVDQQCGSAMAGIHIGFMEIAQDFADIVLVGGYEHMTRVPMGGVTIDRGFAAPNMRLFADPDYLHWDMMTAMNMGLTAEKLFSQTGFTKDDMDRWGVRAHQLAAKAQKEGFFDGEILPIEAEQADGKILKVDRDQAVRGETTIEGIKDLRPAFKKNGVITAGNSSPLNAAATSMILMSKETAKKKGIRPLATLRSIGFAGVDPTIMGAGPVPASKKALEKAGLKAADVDYWEINEAFCIVALNCIKELGIDPERVNVMGGGTAIGHALGATGVRLVGTLARILALKGGRYGCANACVGGGQGVATIIEREKYDW
ncbi:MAG: acetyl-CoA C-acyltransferase [Deltaproteobacteria bacterium CG_4_8_14_3_um_filter_51_11]|nr:acetyl-CoA C-acetyltransferase [bacterium]PIP48662.1 MAG: acetyl-CoA C-acyltransferase [Deltaproteobacteria bacterium CG23_combo_of_CG06-09_8_20_14_all_51_20]PIW00062.1 MAG: acetyl-CoA C-acyltransferase [Deltaproteobacteria bacterium CG17_big_fil_post_rev_8_21_14_2_50_51_6]PIX19822.1 MAG: acetyl-CoA C-acyltransferase [Deltaproteobacteria bacterium CG_4_8_14_3_um_filter_51_11]PIY26072.1 MAG: acetyl-CoA C-acyltransferase [Deltaproteobacteria bacterium CG_4_10_14_3_um_filter_51_14]PJB38935.1 M